MALINPHDCALLTEYHSQWPLHPPVRKIHDKVIVVEQIYYPPGPQVIQSDPFIP